MVEIEIHTYRSVPKHNKLGIGPLPLLSYGHSWFVHQMESNVWSLLVEYATIA